jgi:hypothetical protein
MSYQNRPYLGAASVALASFISGYAALDVAPFFRTGFPVS